MYANAQNLAILQEINWLDKIKNAAKPMGDDTIIHVEGRGSMTFRQSINELVDIINTLELLEVMEINLRELTMAKAHIEALAGILKDYEYKF
jgi:hypothetical protein